MRNLLLPVDGPTARLTHIVVMGMGEPLANLDNLARRPATRPPPRDGLGIGARHVTISTVGLPRQNPATGGSGQAVSPGRVAACSQRCAADRNRADQRQDRPGRRSWTRPSIFSDKTGRQVTFEYVLLAGVNDDRSHARELARLLRGRQAHVNVIPFNEVKGLPLPCPAGGGGGVHRADWQQYGVSVKVRKRKGSMIDAACGQLRQTGWSGGTVASHRNPPRRRWFN